MISVSAGEEEWEKWYNPNDVDHEVDNEMLYQLLKKGCSGDLEGREHEQLKLLLLDQSIDDRHRAQYRARHSIFPMTEEKDKSQPMITFSKYHLDFGFKEGEKCKVGVVLKDKIRLSNKGASKVSFSFSNIPVPSNNIKLTFTPSSGSIKKNSALDIAVEMVVLCTTKVRELVAMDLANSGRHLFTIKLDSKMSQVLDYKELEVGSVIGGGGYGAIYKSKWRGLSVAVKVSENSDGSEFEKELEMHKELLHHPNIVHFVGFCVSPKCLVLEYVDGGSLDKYLGDNQFQFSPELRLKMAYDIAKGMCFLHRSEILHLDLKPQNFLVVSLSLQAPVSIKLADFGLAMSSTRSFYGATVEGSFLYMAPEVFTQKKFSRAADVWSYGACLIEILSGKRPYQEYDQLGYLELARVREEGQSPIIPADITDIEMRKLIESCLHRDHTKRPSFENIEAFLEKKAEEIIKFSQATDVGSSGGSGFFSNGFMQNLNGSSGGSGFFSNSPHSNSPIISNFPNPAVSAGSPSSPLHHPMGSPLLVSNNPNFGRKLPNIPNTNSSKESTRPPLPPRSTTPNPDIVQNKVTRAMTDVSLNEISSRSETLPQRSVTISTPSSTLNLSHQPPVSSSPSSHHPHIVRSSSSSHIVSSRPGTPALVTRPSPNSNLTINTRPSSPLPLKATPPPPPQRSPKSLATPSSSPFSNNPLYSSTNSNSSTDTCEDYFENDDNSLNITTSTNSTPFKPNATNPTSKTPPIPIGKFQSTSTPQMTASSPIHKPPIRASSAIDLKQQQHQQQKPSVSPIKLPASQQQQQNSISPSLNSIISPRQLNVSSGDDTMDSLKFSELRTRSLKVLKDIYMSFMDSVKQFSEVRTLKECIELGQKIRDFKKELEQLCIEHLDVGYESMQEYVKKMDKKTEIKNIQSPPPQHFDGDTYNKVLQFRDAAVTVGESVLDGLFYLMSHLQSNQNNSNNSSNNNTENTSPQKILSTIDKETILKVAKITRAIKLIK